MHKVVSVFCDFFFWEVYMRFVRNVKQLRPISLHIESVHICCLRRWLSRFWNTADWHTAASLPNTPRSTPLPHGTHAHTSAGRGAWQTDRRTVRQTGRRHLIFCFRPGGLSYFGSSLVGGFLCLCFTAMASKRQINGQQNSASPCVPCGANLLRVIIKLRKLEKGQGGAESRQFNKPHQIMTSVIGFCIKRWRERTCAFKYDSDSICLSLFSRTYVRGGRASAFVSRTCACVCETSVGCACNDLDVCRCVLLAQSVCVRYLSLALSLYSGLSDPLSSVWLVEKQRGCGSIWSCNGVKKSELTDSRQSHWGSLNHNKLTRK